MADIVNRVEKSGLISLDLEEVLDTLEVDIYDIAQNLFQGLVLKEKDFRQDIKAFDWSVYAGKNIAVICSVEAIIPTWAFMLIVSKLQPIVEYVMIGTKEEMLNKLVDRSLSRLDLNKYVDAKVVVKGCSDKSISLYAYGEVMRLLQPVASSVMFGEPCSTVPIYKKRVLKKIRRGVSSENSTENSSNE